MSRDMKAKKHILVISQYYYPEQFRINDLTSEWVNRGYRVTVLTGIPNYPEGKKYEGYGWFKRRKDEYNGVKIIRLPIVYRGNSSFMLGLNYLSFVISGFFWNVFTRIKADLVFIFEVSPMTQALPGIRYAKKRRIPCYLYVTDLWPENVMFVTKTKGGVIIRLIDRMVNYIYHNCTKILISSYSFKESIITRGINEDMITYWPYYAEEIYKKVEYEAYKVPEIPNDGVLNLIYAGNIGTAQGLDILPKAASILKDKGIFVRFNIVGDGRYKKNFIALIEQLDVMHMFNFVDKQPIERISDFMAACDAAIICLDKDPVLEMTLPSKLQSCLACGIPICVSGNGEIERVVLESGAGYVSDANNEIKFAESIYQLSKLTKEQKIILSDKAIAYSLKYFNRNELLDTIDEIFSYNE